MICDEDADFQQVQLNSVDTQILEMRRHQIAEISRFWRVPISMLNDLERVQHSNAEILGQQFLSFCMVTIFRGITDTMALTLLKPEERDEFYFEFLVDDLARADLAARMSADTTAVTFEVVEVERFGRGPIMADARVRVEIAGIELELQGVTMRRNGQGRPISSRRGSGARAQADGSRPWCCRKICGTPSPWRSASR